MRRQLERIWRKTRNKSDRLAHKKQGHRLQEGQNSVARFVTRTFRSSYITPLLKFLHLLLVKYSINFKPCCITQRALLLGEPHYLTSLLIHRLNSYSFRSSSFNPLMLPFFNKMSNGFHSRLCCTIP